MMVMYVVNNIVCGVFKYVYVGGVCLGGLICNSCKVDCEIELIENLVVCFNI